MMKGKVLVYAAAIICILAFATVYAVQPDKNDTAMENESLYGVAAVEMDQDLTIEHMLAYAVEEEKLAQAEYKVIFEQYGTEDQQLFLNILEHERQHLKDLKILVEKYNIDLSEDLSSNYVIHPDSLKESISEGVQLQSNLIFMYEKFLEQELPQDIQETFLKLKNDAVGDLKNLNAE